MHTLTKVIQYTGDHWFNLYPLGDIHLGSRHCDEKKLLRTVNQIAEDPHALWIGMGDYAECISLSDPRFCPEEIATRFLGSLGTLPAAQRDAFIDTVRPIAGKCIGLLEGNHEFQLKQHHFIDVTLDACRELGVPFLGDTALVRLTFRHIGHEGGHTRSDTLVVYAEHGSGGGRKTGGKFNSLEDMMGAFEADCYLRGHVHIKGVTKHPILSLGSRGDKLLSRTRVCALTGCYFRTYEKDLSSYGQRASYPPVELGGIVIRYHPMTGELTTVN